MGEINVDYIGLSEAINSMKRIEAGVGYEKITQCYGRGNMENETAELCIELGNIEKQLLTVIKKTNVALKNAGIDFIEVEQEIVDWIENVSSILQK